MVEATLPSLIDQPVEAFNSAFLSKHSQSPEHILGAARGLYEVQKPSSDVPSIVSAVEKLTEDGVPPRISVFLEAITLLKEVGATPEQIQAYEAKILERVPLAEVFSPEEKKKQRRESIMASKEETTA